MRHRGGRSAGAIRVSVGLMSNFADIDIEACRVLRDGS
jgi:hypothetical protein